MTPYLGLYMVIELINKNRIDKMLRIKIILFFFRNNNFLFNKSIFENNRIKGIIAK